MKGIQLGNRKSISLLIDDVCQYMGEPKDSLKRVLKLARQFGKVPGHKIKLQINSKV